MSNEWEKSRKSECCNSIVSLDFDDNPRCFKCRKVLEKKRKEIIDTKKAAGGDDSCEVIE